MKPTKTTGSDAHNAELITEFEAKHSVTLSNNVKEGWRVSEAKVYSMEPLEAAKLVVEAAEAATLALAHSKLNTGE